MPGFKPVSDEMLQRFIDIFDEDGDGQLCEVEFMNFFASGVIHGEFVHIKDLLYGYVLEYLSSVRK